MNLLLTKSEQGIVIFHVWKSLNYSWRLFLSFLFILAGIFIQYEMLNLLPGIILVFAGNLLLLVKGYDNRIKLGKYEHESEWVTIDSKQLEKVVELNARNRKWDISALDISSGLGMLMFFLVFMTLLILAAAHPFYTDDALLIFVLNAFILLLPHWFTGVKRITTIPALVNKIKLYQNLVNLFQKELLEDSTSFLMQLKGKDKKMPADVKLKINFKDQSKEFPGMYAQISMNNVQGRDYPYFYVVLVAKKSSGILHNYRNEEMPVNVISEYSYQDDAEILVIRQFTTKKSGYYTNAAAISVIFEKGLEIGKKVCHL